MASVIDKGLSLLKNSEADYSLKIPLRSELKGPGIRLSSADIFTQMLIPLTRHLKFTINMKIQLGKNGHVSLLVLITSRMCGNFCWLCYLPLGITNCEKLVSWQPLQKKNPVMSAVQVNAN